MPDAFVSYASPDRDAAFRIVEFLEGEGVSCWVAPRDVSPGMEYGEAIIRGIEDSRVLVLILSEESNNSQFVRKEVERAVSKVKPVLPVRIREVSPSGSLEFFIASAQWIDAFKTPMESQLTPLVQAIRGLAGAGAGAAGAPAAAPIRSTAGPLVKRRSRAKAWIAAAIAAVALAAGGWGFLTWRAAAARSDIGFLVGSWCERNDRWMIRHDLVRLGPDTLRGLAHHSHSTQIGEYRVRVKAIPDGFEAAAFGDGSPDLVVQFRVVDDSTILIVSEDGKPLDPPVPRQRCAPDTRS
jgi:hypothetical protein